VHCEEENCIMDSKVSSTSKRSLCNRGQKIRFFGLFVDPYFFSPFVSNKLQCVFLSFVSPCDFYPFVLHLFSSIQGQWEKKSHHLFFFEWLYVA